MGGDEFCVLAEPAAEEPSSLVARAADALSEVGEGFTVSCASGSVLIPQDAHSISEALRIADQRMYAQKSRGRTSASRQSRDVLLQALAARSPELGPHLDEVACLAGELAEALEMSAEEIEQVRTAGELHDVGKMAIPDAILGKPGTLDEAEWEFVRRHSVVGERIVAAAPALLPVSKLVRSVHERWSGGGYPDDLSGGEIPLGARVLAVCDAYHAMTSDRPYRRAMPVEAALLELRRCASSQFDPDVVKAFCRLIEDPPAVSPVEPAPLVLPA